MAQDHSDLKYASEHLFDALNNGIVTYHKGNIDGAILEPPPCKHCGGTIQAAFPQFTQVYLLINAGPSTDGEEFDTARERIPHKVCHACWKNPKRIKKFEDKKVMMHNTLRSFWLPRTG